MSRQTAKRLEGERGNAQPTRILLVDDDDLELELMADRLQSIGFDVATAMNGHEALERLNRERFELLITDREMPVMDGIQLTEQLRAHGVEDTYVIMLTVRDAGLDYERGYLAGVDDYLTKKLPDAELLARVQKGITTLNLRRSLQQARTDLASRGAIDPDSGAHTREHLLTALQTECRRAERYSRNLSVMTVAIETDGQQAVAAATLHRVVDTVRATIRAHVDWIARIEGERGEPVFVVVLPEAATSDAVTIKHRLQGMLRGMDDADIGQLRFSFGFAGLDPTRSDGGDAEPLELITVAEHCRACLRRRGDLQLAAVQASVAQSFSIVCRQGYSLESPCRFMSEAAPATAKESSVSDARDRRSRERG